MFSVSKDLKRAASYIRVSSDEQIDGYSLDAQRRAIQHYCDAHGWELVQEYRDEGLSARTDDLARRPGFVELLEDAEASHFAIVIVHKLDRFARNLKVTLETLDRLNGAGVAFVSISENMDFSTPIGKVILATLGAFAEYYSDNLSAETKKGKAERKRQGLYNGLLPFGVKKGRNGIPVPDPDTYPGLLLAFKNAADGKSDREVAEILNAAGYRTTGNRWTNPFRKDSVRRILINRFYLGALPDGNGWMDGQHQPLIDADLFESAMEARRMNHHGARHTPRKASVYSLSGIGTCGYCRGRLHIQRSKKGRPRLYCYNRTQATTCKQRSNFLDIYETQIEEYLKSFHIPTDYQRQVINLFSKSQADRSSQIMQRKQIERRLERMTELYAWGDIEREDYQQARSELLAALADSKPVEDMAAVIGKTAAFLSNVADAWREANPEQRNRIARLLFEEVEIADRKVAAITPRPDFAPFFVLDCQVRAIRSGSDGIRTRDLHLDRVAC